MRDRERKRLIKEELDKQLKEKNSRKKAEIEEKLMYENLQDQHVKLLEEKEIEKAGLSVARVLRGDKSELMKAGLEKVKSKIVDPAKVYRKAAEGK